MPRCCDTSASQLPIVCACMSVSSLSLVSRHASAYTRTLVVSVEPSQSCLAAATPERRTCRSCVCVRACDLLRCSHAAPALTLAVRLIFVVEPSQARLAAATPQLSQLPLVCVCMCV